MKWRLISLIALAGLTAFAPAPLPRVQRRGDSGTINLSQVQGDWKVVSFEAITGPNNQRSNVLWFQGVRIKGSQFCYLFNGMENQPLQITLDGSKRPATIDFTQGDAKNLVFIGIVRRQGNRFTILYQAPNLTRPTSFENIPLHWWLLELERQ